MTVEGMKKVQEQLKTLRKRRGPVPEALAESVKSVARAQGAVLAALKGGPRTVPELSASTGLPGAEVLWNVTALRKYGQIDDGPARDGYPTYARKERP